ncbi:MAG TPA: response regulator [Tepidisphaeraceae bacterium]|jgi:two-component system phosphate regulon response regulator PhoB|nr:response regulator [Tepidisphaeraceae bacterium]
MRSADSRPSEPSRANAHAPAAVGSAHASRGSGKKTVLVVDDEKDILELITYNLQRNGYDVLSSGNGLQAVEIAQRELPDMLLLDLMLPGLDGTEVTRRLKSDPRTAGIPIIMLTAKAEETDVVVGLTLGADDYVTKPASPKILLARMSAVFRRTETANQPIAEGAILKAGPLTIDTSKHDVTVNGESIKLTLTEFKLISALVTARGRVLTRDQLMDKAMGTDVFVTDRAIDVHITAIRKKLGVASWMVHTVRGVGYRLQESPDAEE